jgi:hypothetical protein
MVDELELTCAAVILTFVPCVWIISKFFYSPTNAEVNCLKNNFKTHIKIDIIATYIHQQGPNNICGHTAELTARMYFN